MKCKTCNQEIKFKERGLHNWKSLFKRPTINDFITLFLLAMLVFAAWGYYEDQKKIKAVFEDPCYVDCRIASHLINNPDDIKKGLNPNFPDSNINYSGIWK